MKIRLHLKFILLVASWWGALSGVAYSQSFMSMAEKAAFADVSNGRYITARNKAENLLKENSDAIGATYIMGLVFWEGEGNLLRALTFMKKALARFEKEYCDPKTGIPTQSEDQMWHQRMLRELARLYSDLDDREAEIDVHTRLAEIYHTALGIDAVWALMKLDRFDEATEIAKKTIENNNNEEYWIDTAYNNLTAIADARHEHLQAYEESLKSVRYSAGRSCVVLTNHARSLMIMLRFDEAIEFLQKARKAKENDCVSNPYEELSAIYLLDTQWQKAISAMLKARKQTVEPRLYAQTESKTRSYTADIFYAMGFAEKAWELYNTVMDAPQRLGYDSLLKEQLLLSQRLVFYAISVDYLKRLDEHIQAWISDHFFYRLASLESLDLLGLFKSEHLKTVSDLYETRNRVQRILWATHQKIFKDALVLKNIRSLIVPMYIFSPQYNFIIVDSIGRKTAEFLVDYQEKSLNSKEVEMIQPIIDHFRAYIAFRNGDDESALNYIQSYRKNVRPRMTLLDQQVQLIYAAVKMRQNDRDEAYDAMAKVYSVAPSLFRQFDLPLPVYWESRTSGVPNGDAIKKMILSSKRFVEMSDAPFRIAFDTTNDGMLQICLNSSMGTRYACSSIDTRDYDLPKDTQIPLPEIVDNFYHAAFSPKVDLSQSDLHSLDGSPVQVSADQALEKLMKASDARIGKSNEDDDIE